MLIDTSGWIEFLHGTGSPTAVKVGHAVLDGFATCDPVRMEVLSGARSERHLQELGGLLARGAELPVTTSQYDEAASLYRQCRQQGKTVRKMLDCLIGATAVSADIPVLHLDADFDAMAACTGLRVA